MHHARRGLFYTGAIVLILMAIVVAVADRLLPLVEQHPDRIAAWLIARSGRPVHFDRAEAHWTNRGPVFALYNLRIGEGKQQLAVDRAELLVAMYSGLLPDHPFTELRLHGLALTIERDASGRWHLVGLSGPQEAENHDPLASLEGLGELQVTDARLTVRSPSQGFAFTSPRVALRMRVYKDRLRAGVRVDAADGSPLLATLDFDRRSNDGTLWIGGDDVDLAPWSGFLGFAGGQVERGRGRIQAWSTLRDRRVVSVQVEAALHDIDVVSHAAIEREGETSLLPSVDLTSLWMSARMRKLPGGWEAVAPRLRLRSREGVDDTLDGIELRDAQGIALAAPSFDAGTLLSIAMLSDRTPPGLREWLTQAAPQVRLSGLRMDLAPDGSLHGEAKMDEASWKPVGNTPAIQGASGHLLFDRDAITLSFDKPDPGKHPFKLLWPPAYGDPVPLEVEGDLTAWRDDGDWTLESSNLRAHNDEIDLSTRVSMRFRHDGRKPRLDLFATVQPARMVDAKRYWLRHRMPPSTVAWLNNAIEGGQIGGAHVIVAGDLDDWPFKHNEGRFDAVADLVDAQLHFNPEWPRAEHVNGRLAFEDDGMRFEGSATIVGIKATQLTAEIANFHAPVLDIRSDALGSGAQMLDLLRQSPLQKKSPETYAALDIQGEALRGTMHLVIPLKHELGEPKVDGDVELSHAGLSDKRWNIAFSDVNGRVHYDQSGVLADGLNVKLKGDPATFRLAIGGATGDRAVVVDATLRGTLPVATLLEHAPTLDWLKPIITGRSMWAVEVKVPADMGKAGAAPTLLSVQSDLRGSELRMPAPLGKSADDAMPLRVTARLPVNAGDLDASLGDVLNLRGRYDDAQGFHGLLAFGSPANGALPAHGLVATGKVDQLDAAGWVAFASGGTGGTGGLQSVDVQAGNLALGGRHFADTRVRMSRQAETTTLRLDGDALAGNITVPADLSRGIHGQFDRLYWPGSSSTPNGGLVADADTDMDPAKVPPLRLDVADVRFGDAKLGHLVLQTHPVAQGLHIDQLDATAKSQTVNATGDWTRSGGATHTQLTIAFTADSLGRMLDAFGFKGVVAAGKTNAKLQASWAGSPTAFRLAVLDGTLDLDVGEGRLLEVKPGAGRILGLVSLAELPRRLSLDFRDFFDKGFSFNTLKGRFVFEGGVARTDNLAIRGPAADIKVTGSADLVGQKYDQTIDVLPKAGGIVTAVGAVVGGPVGAAVGAVAGEVLKHPLQQMGHKRYHVTGPWNNPDVKTVPIGSNTAAASGAQSG
ncbi:MAG TPA: YhdP family protein [Xanthomonadaceae bacterium]|jgi:uncharacterized protein (TIGR02099 family)